uniref:Uncharacterized protein n=1 Tax=Anguilla anguilla TaxID=7936 RepID=A0A0E9VYP8_ANGAN
MSLGHSCPGLQTCSPLKTKRERKCHLYFFFSFFFPVFIFF